MIRRHLTSAKIDGAKHKNGLVICPLWHHRAENKLLLFLTKQGYKYKGLLMVSSEDTPFHQTFPTLFKIAIFIYLQAVQNC